MPGLVNNNSAIQITFFGTILSSSETLGISDLANISNSDLLPNNLLERVNQANEDAGVVQTESIQSTLLNIQADDLQVTSVSITDEELVRSLKEKELAHLNGREQNFYQILTQQPKKFDISNVDLNLVPLNMTTSKIYLQWDFSNIILKNNNIQSNDNYVRYSNSINTNSILPFIRNIYIDISSIHSNPPSNWLNLHTFNVTHENYDIDYYKSFIVNKFNNLTPTNDVEYILSLSNELFDIRVYGTNDSLDFPTIYDRSIVYYNCKFLAANTPSKPILLNNYSISNNKLD